MCEGVSSTHIGIFGSCVSRDLLEDPALRPALGQYTSRSSVISVVDDPVPLDPDAVRLDSAFQKRCVVDDFAKTFFDQLEERPPDWLLVDLVDERFEVVRTGGSCVTRSSAFISAGLDDALEPTDGAVRRLTREADALLDAAIARFTERLTGIVPAHRVVVHRAGWMTGYRDGDAIHAFTDERAAFAERHNAALDRAYDALEARLDGAPVIALDRRRYVADAQHRWKLEPFHYEPAYNAAAIDRLRNLVAA
jgi:hypothetical protein